MGGPFLWRDFHGQTEAARRFTGSRLQEDLRRHRPKTDCHSPPRQIASSRVECFRLPFAQTATMFQEAPPSQDFPDRPPEFAKNSARKTTASNVIGLPDLYADCLP